MLLRRMAAAPGVRRLSTCRPKPFSERCVRDILNLAEQARKVQSWTVECGTTVFDATRQMVEHRTGSLCVTKDGHIVGIVTERDYLTKVLHAGRTSKTTAVEEISTMHDKLIVAAPHDTLQDCIDMMALKHVRHLPIAEGDGSVVALLDVQDLAKALSDERYVTLHTLDEIRTASKMPIHDG